jgi:hypothetical protein
MESKKRTSLHSFQRIFDLENVSIGTAGWLEVPLTLTQPKTKTTIPEDFHVVSKVHHRK